jgi:hypothetical protein
MEKVKEQGEHWESKTIENGRVSVGNKKAIGKVLYIYIFVIGPTQVVTNFWSFYFFTIVTQGVGGLCQLLAYL